MKNMQTLMAALALAATTSAVGIIEDGWGGDGGHGGGGGGGWGHEENKTTSYVTSYTTFTTDLYTTYCPSPTKVTVGTKTYTVTSSQTLTITDCPCTVTKPVKPTKPSSISAKPTHPHNTTSIVPPPHTKNTTSIVPPPHTKNTTATTTKPATSSTTLCPTCAPAPPASSSHGLSTSFTKITSFFTTSVPPHSTEVVVSGTTYPVSKTGEVTIPIVATSPVVQSSPPSPPQPTAPVTTAPLEITNNGVQNGASLGAFVAGLAALLL